MKIENLDLAFYVEVELDAINDYNNNLNLIKRKKKIISNNINCPEDQLEKLQNEIEVAENDNEKLAVHVLYGFQDIDSVYDIPYFIKNSKKAIQEQCSNVLLLYNEILKIEDVKVEQIMLYLRSILTAFASFDDDGYGTICNEITFHKYLKLLISIPLFDLIEYVDKVNVNLKVAALAA